MGVRKIRSNYRSVTGRIPTKKNADSTAFESKLERDFLMLLEFDPAVRTIAEQPVRIHFPGGTYTPDVYATFHERARRIPIYFEVKYRSELFKLWKELHPGFRAAARYAMKTQCRFKIVTELEIRTVRLDNIKKLWRFRSVEISPQERACVVGALKALGTSTISMLLDNLTHDVAGRESFQVVIGHLIATGIIGTDLDGSRLTNSSAIWIGSDLEAS
jgi:hypothetical protein